MAVYTYGGYVICGGKLDNGSPWKGFRILLASIPENGGFPMGFEVGKMTYKDDAEQFLRGLRIGSKLDVTCDLKGRVTGLAPVK